MKKAVKGKDAIKARILAKAKEYEKKAVKPTAKKKK